MHVKHEVNAQTLKLRKKVTLRRPRISDVQSCVKICACMLLVMSFKMPTTLSLKRGGGLITILVEFFCIVEIA